MSDNTYQPPKVWEWKKNNGGAFANINRPISGATHEKDLPVGSHPLQLYSLGTPNGQKVTIMLEELLALGVTGAEYDAWLIRIGEGDQFSSGFVEYNAAEFLDAEKYTNVQRWAKDVANRHAVKRGRIVNRTSGELNEQLHERHAASDFETNTEDKRQA